MLQRAHSFLVFPLFVMLLMAVPVQAQVEPSATGDPGAALDDSEMMTPPPVSGMPYANTSGSEARSNYLSVNVTVSPSYIDNVLLGSTPTPVSDITYSILPSVTFDRSTPRQKEQISFSPSFTFYEPTTNIGSADQNALATAFDQNASAAFQYRFNPKVAFSVQDSFTRTSDVYNSSYVFSNSVTGSSSAPTPTVIAPFAQQLINTVNGVL